MCFDWLKRRFQREKTREEKEKLQKEIEARILADYRRQVAKTGKIVNISSHGGPTMPKYQPCPNCQYFVEDKKEADGFYHIYCKRRVG